MGWEVQRLRRSTLGLRKAVTDDPHFVKRHRMFRTSFVDAHVEAIADNIEATVVDCRAN